MTTSITSQSATSSPEQRKREYKALMGIIVSSLEDKCFKGSRTDALGATWTIPDLEHLVAVISLPATTAHCILRQGVPSSTLPALSEYMGIGKGALAELVDLDRATAFRKVANDKPLPIHAAESVLRLLELNQMAEDTFESTEEAAAWLRRGHPLLGGESPLDWSRTAYGAERVREILVAAKYGGAV